MEAPSLVTVEERQAIAKEIASKYLSFATSVTVAFYKDVLVIKVYPDKYFSLPSGHDFITIERDSF